MGDATPILPAHVESTVADIARLHAEHHARATPMHRFVEQLTARTGTPGFVVGILVVAALWIAVNLAIQASGGKSLDPPPFAWAQGVIALAALLMTAMILTTQRYDDELAAHREQLTLELSILGEQKSAKIIQLIDELRRDSPHLIDRVDHEAAALSTPADPQSVLDAIKIASAELADDIKA